MSDIEKGALGRSRSQSDIDVSMCSERCVWRQLYDGFADEPTQMTREDCVSIQAEVRETGIKGLAIHNCGIAAVAIKLAADNEAL